MWRAYLMMVALALPSVNRLAGMMAERPDLVELCGLERPPSQPALARFCRVLGENIADVEKSFQPITGMKNWRAMPEDLRDLVRALDGVIMILGPTNDNILDGQSVDRRLGPKMTELRLRTRVRPRLKGTAPEDPGNIDLAIRMADTALKNLLVGIMPPADRSDELDARLEAVEERLFGKAEKK